MAEKSAVLARWSSRSTAAASTHTSCTSGTRLRTHVAACSCSADVGSNTTTRAVAESQEKLRGASVVTRLTCCRCLVDLQISQAVAADSCSD